MTTTANAESRVLIRVWGDFNGLEPTRKGRRRMPLATDFWKPAKGDGVLVCDEDGNELEGRVVRVTSWGCYADMDMETWRAGPPFRGVTRE